jgi:hypothetical protein
LTSYGSVLYLFTYEIYRSNTQTSSPLEAVMSQPALAAAPTPAEALEEEVREALQVCGGDPMKALRITLIANAFLEARIDELTAEVSAGYARRKIGTTVKQAVGQANV